MTLLTLLTGFVIYTLLWMAFTVVLLRMFSNHPVFGNRKNQDEDFKDLNDMTPADMEAMLQARVGNPANFTMPGQEEEDGRLDQSKFFVDPTEADPNADDREVQ